MIETHYPVSKVTSRTRKLRRSDGWSVDVTQDMGAMKSFHGRQDKVVILKYGGDLRIWFSDYKLIGQWNRKGTHIKVLKAPDKCKRTLKEAAFMERYFEELL